MYENGNKQSGNKEMWGCVGAVGTALIAGIVTLIIASPTLIPFFFGTPTPTTAILPPAIVTEPPAIVVVQPTLPATNIPVNLPTATEIPQIIPSIAATPDCWQTIWSFNPSSESDIILSLSSPRTGYKAYFDSNTYSDGSGSLRLETSKVIPDPMQDQNSWSWMINTQPIAANNGLYRVTANIKTQSVVASHISIVGRNKNGNDVFNGNTNRMSVVPFVGEAIYGTYDWKPYSSSEFNPKEWSSDVMYLAIGINAGWSPDRSTSITWFDDVRLQYCNK